MSKEENPKASSMNEDTQVKVSGALEGFKFNVTSGTVEFAKNTGSISIGNGTLESYSRVPFDGLHTGKNSYVYPGSFLNIENGTVKLSEMKSWEKSFLSSIHPNDSITKHPFGEGDGKHNFTGGKYFNSLSPTESDLSYLKSITSKYHTPTESDLSYLKSITSKHYGIYSDPLAGSGLIKSTGNETVQLSKLNEIQSTLLSSTNEAGIGVIKNPLFETSSIQHSALSGRMNILDGTLYVSGASNFLKGMGLPEAVAKSENMIVKDAYFKVDTDYGVKSLFIKDGLYKVDPNQRLADGSLSYLKFDANNKISYDTSFVAGSLGFPTIEKSTQNILSGMDWNKVGSIYNVDNLMRAKIQDGFLDLSESYFKLYDPNAKFGLANYPELASLSATEYLNHAALLRFSSDPQNEQSLDEVTLVKAEVVDYLNALNPDLKTMYLGAIDSFRSKNRDRVRQFSISLRELYTHVADILAPVKSVKAWSQKEVHYSNGRPTRRARLEYIGRNIKGEGYEKFMYTDINSVLEFLDLFQSGTHCISPRYTDEEMKRMLTRMEGVILLLIKSSRIN